MSIDGDTPSIGPTPSHHTQHPHGITGNNVTAQNVRKAGLNAINSNAVSKSATDPLQGKSPHYFQTPNTQEEHRVWNIVKNRWPNDAFYQEYKTLVEKNNALRNEIDWLQSEIARLNGDPIDPAKTAQKTTALTQQALQGHNLQNETDAFRKQHPGIDSANGFVHFAKSDDGETSSTSSTGSFTPQVRLPHSPGSHGNTKLPTSGTSRTSSQGFNVDEINAADEILTRRTKELENAPLSSDFETRANAIRTNQKDVEGVAKALGYHPNAFLEYLEGKLDSTESNENKAHAIWDRLDTIQNTVTSPRTTPGDAKNWGPTLKQMHEVITKHGHDVALDNNLNHTARLKPQKTQLALFQIKELIKNLKIPSSNHEKTLLQIRDEAEFIILNGNSQDRSSAKTAIVEAKVEYSGSPPPEENGMTTNIAKALGFENPMKGFLHIMALDKSDTSPIPMFTVENSSSPQPQLFNATPENFGKVAAALGKKLGCDDPRSSPLLLKLLGADGEPSAKVNALRDVLEVEARISFPTDNDWGQAIEDFASRISPQVAIPVDTSTGKATSQLKMEQYKEKFKEILLETQQALGGNDLKALNKAHSDISTLVKAISTKKTPNVNTTFQKVLGQLQEKRHAVLLDKLKGLGINGFEAVKADDAIAQDLLKAVLALENKAPSKEKITQETAQQVFEQHEQHVNELLEASRSLSALITPIKSSGDKTFLEPLQRLLQKVFTNLQVAKIDYVEIAILGIGEGVTQGHLKKVLDAQDTLKSALQSSLTYSDLERAQKLNAQVKDTIQAYTPKPEDEARLGTQVYDEMLGLAENGNKTADEMATKITNRIKDLDNHPHILAFEGIFSTSQLDARSMEVISNHVFSLLSKPASQVALKTYVTKLQELAKVNPTLKQLQAYIKALEVIPPLREATEKATSTPNADNTEAALKALETVSTSLPGILSNLTEKEGQQVQSLVNSHMEAIERQISPSKGWGVTSLLFGNTTSPFKTRFNSAKTLVENAQPTSPPNSPPTSPTVSRSSSPSSFLLEGQQALEALEKVQNLQDSTDTKLSRKGAIQAGAKAVIAIANGFQSLGDEEKLEAGKMAASLHSLVSEVHEARENAPSKNTSFQRLASAARVLKKEKTGTQELVDQSTKSANALALEVRGLQATIDAAKSAEEAKVLRDDVEDLCEIALKENSTGASIIEARAAVNNNLAYFAENPPEENSQEETDKERLIELQGKLSELSTQRQKDTLDFIARCGKLPEGNKPSIAASLVTLGSTPFSEDYVIYGNLESIAKAEEKLKPFEEKTPLEIGNPDDQKALDEVSDFKAGLSTAKVMIYQDKVVDLLQRSPNVGKEEKSRFLQECAETIKNIDKAEISQGAEFIALIRDIISLHEGASIHLLYVINEHGTLDTQNQVDAAVKALNSALNFTITSKEPHQTVKEAIADDAEAMKTLSGFQEKLTNAGVKIQIEVVTALTNKSPTVQDPVSREEFLERCNATSTALDKLYVETDKGKASRVELKSKLQEAITYQSAPERELLDVLSTYKTTGSFYYVDYKKAESIASASAKLTLAMEKVPSDHPKIDEAKTLKKELCTAGLSLLEQDIKTLLSKELNINNHSRANFLTECKTALTALKNLQVPPELKEQIEQKKQLIESAKSTLYRHLRIQKIQAIHSEIIQKTLFNNKQEFLNIITPLLDSTSPDAIDQLESLETALSTRKSNVKDNKHEIDFINSLILDCKYAIWICGGKKTAEGPNLLEDRPYTSLDEIKSALIGKTGSILKKFEEIKPELKREDGKAETSGLSQKQKQQNEINRKKAEKDYYTILNTAQTQVNRILRTTNTSEERIDQLNAFKKELSSLIESLTLAENQKEDSKAYLDKDGIVTLNNQLAPTLVLVNKSISSANNDIPKETEAKIANQKQSIEQKELIDIRAMFEVFDARIKDEESLTSEDHRTILETLFTNEKLLSIPETHKLRFIYPVLEKVFSEESKENQATNFSNLYTDAITAPFKSKVFGEEKKRAFKQLDLYIQTLRALPSKSKNIPPSEALSHVARESVDLLAQLESSMSALNSMELPKAPKTSTAPVFGALGTPSAESKGNLFAALSGPHKLSSASSNKPPSSQTDSKGGFIIDREQDKAIAQQKKEEFSDKLSNLQKSDKEKLNQMINDIEKLSSIPSEELSPVQVKALEEKARTYEAEITRKLVNNNGEDFEQAEKTALSNAVKGGKLKTKLPISLTPDEVTSLKERLSTAMQTITENAKKVPSITPPSITKVPEDPLIDQ